MLENAEPIFCESIVCSMWRNKNLRVHVSTNSHTMNVNAFFLLLILNCQQYRTLTRRYGIENVLQKFKCIFFCLNRMILSEFRSRIFGDFQPNALIFSLVFSTTSNKIKTINSATNLCKRQ